MLDSVSSSDWSMTPQKMRTLWHALSDWDKAQLIEGWPLWASGAQCPPKEPWMIWLILGGRGAGKTRAGAEWVRARVKAGARHISLVAPTFNEAREVMLEGESGLLNIGHPAERPYFTASRQRLDWPNGTIGHVYSAEDPDGLRGSQCDTAWADEFCAWPYAEAVLSNLRLSLRLGDDPRLTVTTTPRPTAALLALRETTGVVLSHMRTQDNAQHLAPGFLAAMEASYGGTPLGQQELEGEILMEHPGALWSLAGIAAQRVTAAPELSRIVVAVDPPATSGPKADACGLIVAGGAGDRAYVLEDATLHRATPERWAEKTVALFHQYEADCVIAEGNQGGEMVEAVLRQVDTNLPIRRVHARRGKTARAEPISHLYTRGRVFHVGRFDALEAQMCVMGSPAQRGSPDRVDALVWALQNLLLDTTAQPRLRWM